MDTERYEPMDRYEAKGLKLERPLVLAYEHTQDYTIKLNGPDTQAALKRVLEWSASTPCWAANWVPEFSTWDAEVASRAWGVILDEARLRVPEAGQ
jgi:hypothetical protein